MALLIDGYNLLHVTGLFGRGPSASFEASRNALLGFLAAAIEPEERNATTIVFDATHAPPGLPNLYTVAGICVHFARGYESADALLEELIAAHHTPRKLTVVSSDNRVQRAAKKRKAIAVESHAWYQAAAEQLKSRQKKRKRDLPDIKPDKPLTPGEVQSWLQFFGPIDVPVDMPALVPPPLKSESPAKPPKTRVKMLLKTKKAARAEEVPAPKPARVKKPVVRKPAKKRKPKDLGFGDIKNPFPPGYGEDISE